MAERKTKHMGCSLQTTQPGGKLRFRFRWPLPGENRAYRHAETTALDDTPENRERLRPQCAEIGRQIRAGTFSYLAWFPNGRKALLYLRAGTPAPKKYRAGETVSSYFERWIELQPARVAHTTLLGYRSHFKKSGGILELLGDCRVADLTRDDLEHLRSAMLEAGATQKYVKNVIGGTLRAFARDAVDAGMLERDLFVNFRWKRVAFEGADPYSAEERDTALDALRKREFRFGRGSGAYSKRPHFAYYVAAYTIAWTGMRPEEVVALQVRDFDPKRPGFAVRRSAGAGRVGGTKTVQAERQAAITPENAELVRLLIPLRAKETEWIFKAPEGGRMDQAKLNDAFTAECHRLGIPTRGLYALKDTFCSLYISAPGATWGVAVNADGRGHYDTEAALREDPP
jgi:integrase